MPTVTRVGFFLLLGLRFGPPEVVRPSKGPRLLPSSVARFIYRSRASASRACCTSG
jgi:hypothetical protein